jgi:hypothetical protein
MRSPLLGVNTLALAALAAPAVMILASSFQALAKAPLWAAASIGAVAIGCLCLFAAMQRLNERGVDKRPGGFAGLLSLGVVLVGAPMVAILLLTPPA